MTRPVAYGPARSTCQLPVQRRELRGHVAQLVAKQPRPRETDVDRPQPVRQRPSRGLISTDRQPLRQIEIRPVAVDLQTGTRGQGQRPVVESQRASLELQLPAPVPKRQARARGARAHIDVGAAVRGANRASGPWAARPPRLLANGGGASIASPRRSLERRAASTMALPCLAVSRSAPASSPRRPTCGCPREGR